MSIDIKKIIENTNNPKNIKYNFLELRESNIHELGVFATEDIPANKVITYYPCHMINCDKLGQNFSIHYDLRHFKNENIINLIADTHYMFSLDGFNIYGLKDVYDDTLLLGHKINDGCNINIDKNETNVVKIKNEVIKYSIQNKNINNCIIEPYDGILQVRTLKDIKKGDEILAGYDFMYWITKEQLNIFMNDILKYNSKELLKFLNILKIDITELL